MNTLLLSLDGDTLMLGDRPVGGSLKFQQCVVFCALRFAKLGKSTSLESLAHLYNPESQVRSVQVDLHRSLDKAQERLGVRLLLKRQKTTGQFDPVSGLQLAESLALENPHVRHWLGESWIRYFGLPSVVLRTEKPELDGSLALSQGRFETASQWLEQAMRFRHLNHARRGYSALWVGSIRALGYIALERAQNALLDFEQWVSASVEPESFLDIYDVRLLEAQLLLQRRNAQRAEDILRELRLAHAEISGGTDFFRIRSNRLQFDRQQRQLAVLTICVAELSPDAARLKQAYIAFEQLVDDALPVEERVKLQAQLKRASAHQTNPPDLEQLQDALDTLRRPELIFESKLGAVEMLALRARLEREIMQWSPHDAYLQVNLEVSLTRWEDQLKYLESHYHTAQFELERFRHAVWLWENNQASIKWKGVKEARDRAERALEQYPGSAWSHDLARLNQLANSPKKMSILPVVELLQLMVLLVIILLVPPPKLNTAQLPNAAGVARQGSFAGDLRWPVCTVNQGAVGCRPCDLNPSLSSCEQVVSSPAQEENPCALDPNILGCTPQSIPIKMGFSKSVQKG